ncbi:MAG TPA: hypothetical protein VFY10_07065 [Dehalococcoidia bacterium]|nr:hypothetical protein [Dehalococcoidia bacterium]
MSNEKTSLLERLESAVLDNDSADGHAKGLLKPWMWWDHMVLHFWPIGWVGDSETVGVRPGTYHGKTTTLSDGTELQADDRILELHINGPRLMQLTSASEKSHWATFRAVRSDLQVMATAVGNGDFGDVRALHGITLYTLPARWVGFEIEPVRRTAYWRLNQFFMRGLSRIYEPGSARKTREARVGPWPHEVWLGRNDCNKAASRIDAS